MPHTFACTMCDATIDPRMDGVRLDRYEARAVARKQGWTFGKASNEPKCPKHRHRLQSFDKTQTPVVWGRLSASFLEQRKAIDDEYARIRAEREARDAAEKEAVFAQGRRQLPEHLERAIAGRGRQMIGIRTNVSKVA